MMSVARASHRTLLCAAIGAAAACGQGGSEATSFAGYPSGSDASRDAPGGGLHDAKGDFDAGPVTRADGSAAETGPVLLPATATVTGAWQGAPFAAKGGALTRFYWDNGPTDAGAPTDLRAAVSIIITQYASACTTARDTTAPVLSLYLRSADAELSPGTFPIVDSWISGGSGPPPQGTANLFGLSATDCGVSNLDQAKTGMVTLTVVDAVHVEGTFDITMGVGGSYMGSFSLPDCRGVVALDDTDPTVRCVL
jgi:hypothetical protein